MQKVFQDTPATLLSQLHDANHGAAWERAWDDFVRFYQPAIRAAIESEFYSCGWKSLSPDLVAETSNEVFIRFLRAQVSFRYDPAKGKLRGYLTQLIGWIVKDKLRASLRNPLTRAQDLEPSTEPSIEILERVMEKEDRAWKDAVLGLLLEECRRSVSPQTYMIFELTKLQEMPVETVMLQLGVSRSTVDSANHRMSRKLQQLLDNPDYRKELLP